MNRWTSFLGAIVLVLIVLTSGAAHAAESLGCISANTEASIQYGGEQDSAPSAPNNCATHSHNSCSGHHAMAPANAPSIEVALLRENTSFSWREAAIPDYRPDSDLRPPIA